MSLSGYGLYKEEKNLFSLPGIKPRRPAGSLVAIATELSRLQQLTNIRAGYCWNDWVHFIFE
jgi:hypothetical protein